MTNDSESWKESQLLEDATFKKTRSEIALVGLIWGTALGLLAGTVSGLSFDVIVMPTWEFLDLTYTGGIVGSVVGLALGAFNGFLSTTDSRGYGVGRTSITVVLISLLLATILSLYHPFQWGYDVSSEFDDIPDPIAVPIVGFIATFLLVVSVGLWANYTLLRKLHRSIPKQGPWYTRSAYVISLNLLILNVAALTRWVF